MRLCFYILKTATISKHCSNVVLQHAPFSVEGFIYACRGIDEFSTNCMKILFLCLGFSYNFVIVKVWEQFTY